MTYYRQRRNENSEDNSNRDGNRYRRQLLGRRAWVNADVLAATPAVCRVRTLPGSLPRCAAVLAESMAGRRQGQALISPYASTSWYTLAFQGLTVVLASLLICN